MDPRKKMLIEKKHQAAMELVKRFLRNLNNNATPYKEAAKELGVGPSIITMWKKGERFPSEKMKEKIELYIAQHTQNLPPVYEIMDKLRQYLAETNESLEKVAEKIGTSEPNLVRWLSGQVIPGKENIEKLVGFLYSQGYMFSKDEEQKND